MKRLIVLCDGTEQSVVHGKDALPTNVKRFGDCLDSNFDSEHPQIVYYQSGVGAVGHWLSRTIAQGFGDGVDANILDAYIFLCNNHVDWDDEIFIFGFSRGAFTARVLANLVVRLGLFRKSVSWMTRRAWSQYVEGPESFDFFVNQLNGMRAGERSGFTKPVNVKVLGVWDTVGAIGIPDYNAVKVLRHDDKNKFYDTRLHYGIEHAFHALALDEYRFPFNPTLLYIPEKPSQAEIDKTPSRYKKIELKQCWFAGAHTDVGGGYASEHMANISLAWMIDQCRMQNLLRFYTDAEHHQTIELRRTKYQSSTKSAEPPSKPRLASLPKYLRIVRDHHCPSNLRDTLHRPKDPKLAAVASEESYPGWGCGRIRDSFKEMAVAVSWQYRSPGNYPDGEYLGPGGPLPAWHTATETLYSVASNIPLVGSWFAKSEPASESKHVGERFCTSDKCAHPVSLWDQPGGTNETIHASVFARYEAMQAKKLEQPWEAKSLAMFVDEKTGDIRRVTNVSNLPQPKLYPFTAVWEGRCYKTNKPFLMYEEPDQGLFEGGMTQLLMQEDDMLKALSKLNPDYDPNELTLTIPKYEEKAWMEPGFKLQEWKKKNKPAWEEYCKKHPEAHKA